MRQEHLSLERKYLLGAKKQFFCIRIFMLLDEGTLSFSQLRRVTGIRSSGQMMFHLFKLAGLIKVANKGNYELPSQDVQAVRFPSTTYLTRNESSARKKLSARSSNKQLGWLVPTLLFLLGVTLLLAGSFINSQVVWQPATGGSYSPANIGYNITIPPDGVYSFMGYGNSGPHTERIVAFWSGQPIGGLEFAVVSVPPANPLPLGVSSALYPNSSIIALSDGSLPYAELTVKFTAEESHFYTFVLINTNPSPVKLTSFTIVEERPLNPYGNTGTWLEYVGAACVVGAFLIVVRFLITGKREMKPNFDWDEASKQFLIKRNTSEPHEVLKSSKAC